jgi:hypothetical protein
MALRVGFNEGSLLRRTLLHVGTFVAGTVAFVAIASFVLVSITKGLLPPVGGGGSKSPGAAGISEEVVDGVPTPGKLPLRIGSHSRHEPSPPPAAGDLPPLCRR